MKKSLAAIGLLLVGMVALGAWIAPSFYRVYEREVIRMPIYERGGRYHLASDRLGGAMQPPLPKIWSILGATASDVDIELPDDVFTDAEIEHVRELFPEVEVRKVRGPIP
ncbi:MAG: hypothetical protein WD845_14715 [Pirellulales bacterium]